jgi:hypothetical protein
MKIKNTDTSPYVELNLDTPVFMIKGNAFSHEADQIFSKVLHWIDDNLPNLDSHLNCEIEIYVLKDPAYSNFFEIIEKIQYYISIGKNITLTWYCDIDDEDMYEMAEDIRFTYNIPVTIRLKRINQYQ